MTARTIVRTTEDGSLAPFFEPDAAAGGLFGMAVDRRGKALWVAESSGPGIPGSTGARRTGLLKLALDWCSKFFKLKDRHAHSREFRGRAFRLDTKPSLRICIDGEVLAQTPANVKIAPKAVTVALPG